MNDALAEEKAKLRRKAYDARDRQEDREGVSRTIIGRATALREYVAANTVMWYLDVGSEVRTRHGIGEALKGGKRLVVPYCTADEHRANKLGLWRLTDVDELVVGRWRLLEPPRDRWGEPGKEIDPRELDLVMVPGVGFTRDGARIGSGHGYYDRFFRRVRPDASLVALAFERQLWPDLPMTSHDVYMDKVVTEQAVYEGRGRSFHVRGPSTA